MRKIQVTKINGWFEKIARFQVKNRWWFIGILTAFLQKISVLRTIKRKFWKILMRLSRKENLSVYMVQVEAENRLCLNF